MPDDGFTDYARAIRKRLCWEAYRLCRDWYEAEDLAQLTLHKVHRRWGRLTAQDQMIAYTRRALLHVYLSERRRLRWRYEVSQPEPPDTTATAVGNHTVDDRVVLVAALNRLGPRQRAVVVLRFLADLSVEQTAAAMGCSIKTVTSQTHRALATLRKLLPADSARARCVTATHRLDDRGE
jgi:RNA polymerase sigma-70 factor (sigma-E family)